MIYKVFKANKNSYLYDRQENRIVKIDEADYKGLCELEKGIITEENEKVIKKYEKYGLCKENELIEIEHPNTASLEFYLNECIEQITLQVTQNCNLRCDYCAYSGKYNNRTHSKKSMSFETAYKAIDFLVKHSRCTKKSIVGFYGGEPLLEINLIKEVISYIETNYEGKEFTYAMTTNATLLTDEIVNYLAAKDVWLTISIDGPKSIHDLNRCFENGRGSYDIVIKNLARMKERYPDYYRKCSTNTVISPNQEYDCIKNFFTKDDVMDSLYSKVSFISDASINRSIVYEDAVFIEQRKDELKQMLSMLGEIDNSSTKFLFGDYDHELHRKYVSLHMGGLHAKKGHPSGPCIAGGKKTFIDIDGNIYPCEKVPECKEMTLGNINTGISVEKAKDMMNIARITKKQCQNCWAFIFCTSCVVASIDENGISAEKRLSKCNGVRRSTLEYLKNIIRLQEYGYRFETVK
ncbi:Cys-rich peptide radical SAM maturase CcpM [Anaerocolumna sp. MB42-C2]|uniref:Cys-rich peptide radical SAM maturase CcpM n=1 Tax=Anaerocolumna sp. MB42-C2 TaxID=3070997 RepID=UPI0027DFBD71|nr:Cys-rich peptide radical SAM maturase CcpM [Anaerocolumna sp. MB42-C2]WMJ85630.1 Cys-rich peptide radical SAM maturase CcpM [Anaerocolumna sp. MB42-C2]